MTEEQYSIENALARFVRTLRDDLKKVVDSGLFPVAYIIAFKEPTVEKYETMRYIARWTRDCPSGLDRALDEALHKWLAQTSEEFFPVSEMPNYEQ